MPPEQCVTMPVLWCSISSHGFGHAAQVVPVLNALGRLVSGLTIILRTHVSPSFFRSRLHIPWSLSAAEQDVGCVQQGPLYIDAHGTWSAYRHFHEGWKAKVEAEAQAIRAAKPNLILSDISYLAVEAGTRAGIPSVGFGSLSWDRVLELYLESGRGEQVALLQQIRGSYGTAELMIRLAPGLPMTAFPSVVDVGPIAELVAPDVARLREAIGFRPPERIVLVAFGGIPLEALPFDALEHLEGYRFIVYGPVPENCERVRSAESLPMAFRTVLASADIIMTKPGYSTIVEAVAYRTPVVYVRRYNFADETVLVEYLNRYGAGIELSADDFEKGNWRQALNTASGKNMAATPPDSGTAEAAAILASRTLR